jgi:hypothetical protein
VDELPGMTDFFVVRVITEVDGLKFWSSGGLGLVSTFKQAYHHYDLESAQLTATRWTEFLGFPNCCRIIKVQQKFMDPD